MRTGEEWGGLLLLGKPPLEEGDWYDYSRGFTEDALAEVARIARDEALEDAALLAHEESIRADRNEGHPGAACRRIMAAIRALKEGK